MVLVPVISNHYFFYCKWTWHVYLTLSGVMLLSNWSLSHSFYDFKLVFMIFHWSSIYFCRESNILFSKFWSQGFPFTGPPRDDRCWFRIRCSYSEDWSKRKDTAEKTTSEREFRLLCFLQNDNWWYVLLSFLAIIFLGLPDAFNICNLR